MARAAASVNTVWPDAIVQTCIIHLIRGSFRYASRKYWDELSRDLRPIYTAPSEAAALAALEALDEKWGARYPALSYRLRNRMNLIPGSNPGPDMAS